MAIQFVTQQIKDSAINAAKLGTDAVTTAKVLNSNITLAKIEDLANNKVLGNLSGGAAAPSALTVDASLSASASNLASSLAIKTYVDAEISTVSATSWKDNVKLATTAAIAGAYNNGTNGDGATITYNANGVNNIDGVAVAQDDRVLVKNGLSGGGSADYANGIYIVSTVGDATTAQVLTRALDVNSAAKITSCAVIVDTGSNNAGQAWYLPSFTGAMNGSTAINFSRFRQLDGGGGVKITATPGPMDDLEIDLSTDPGLEIHSDDKLRVKVKAETGGSITRDSGGLYIADSAIGNDKLAGSIANGKLANSTVSYGGVSLALGASDATPAFDLADATNYPTTALVGTITNAQLAGSIANGKLSNSSLTVTAGDGLSGGGAIALGASASIALDLNELTAVGVDVANDFIAIVDATDNSTKKDAIADLVDAFSGNGLSAASGVQAVLANGSTINVSGSGIKVADGQIDTTQLKDDAVTLAKLGATPKSEIAHSQSGTTYAWSSGLADADLTQFEFGFRVYLNGQRIENVGASGNVGTDISKYKVSSSGGTTTITFGAALSSDSILIDYWV